jgi:hypothetical protein
MRKLSMVLGLTVALVLVIGLRAEDKKADEEVTLKGTITCAKCDLKKEKTCMTVIVVKKGDKETVYYLDKESGKKVHKKICTEAKKGEVKGTVKKEDDKMIITVKDVKADIKFSDD